ncbi:MAG: C39 family peptidase, partial [Deltaproteobacteria bacterium]
MNPARAISHKVVSLLLLTALLVSATAIFPANLTLAEPLPDQEKQDGFSGLPFVAPSVSDPQTLALYWVEGKNPIELLLLKEMTINDKVDYRLSPDGQTIALLLQKSSDGSSSVELVRRSDLRRLPVAKGNNQQITSLVWVNDRQIAYTKVSWITRSQASQDVLRSVFKVARSPLAAGEADLAPTPESEVWLSNLDGTQQRLLVKAPLYRILSLAPDAQTLYATTLRPGAELWRVEEFAFVDTKTGAVEKPWASQFGAKWFYGFKLVDSPDHTPQVVFFEGEAPGRTVLRKPPAIWIGDLNTRQAQKVWEVTHSFAGPKNTTAYYLPSDFSWASDTWQEFVYVMNHQLWRVNLQEKVETEVREADRILAWNEQGLALEARGDLILSDRDGQSRAEIPLARNSQAGTLAPAAAVVNYNVPFVHQVYDTADAFNGNWACGPTSAVMALAYFQKIAAHPIQISIPTPHYNDYGWYVSEQYTYQSACTGAHTFDRQQPDASGNMARGAYGSCTTDGWSYKTLINTYVGNHDLRANLDDSPTTNEVQAELANGAVVILGTQLTGSGGHIVIARGYNDNGTFIVNDPYGAGADGSFDGSNVTYTWSQMVVLWSLAVGPQSTCSSNGTFSNLSADLQGTGSATFRFAYSGSSSYYRIHMSINPNMVTGVYWNFGGGPASPVVEANPRKWDQYTCGHTLYWWVESSTGVNSPIQTAQVSGCTGGGGTTPMTGHGFDACSA